MKTKGIKIEIYLTSIYLPMYFMKFCSKSNKYVFSADNIEIPTSNELTLEDINKYISSNSDSIKELVYDQLIASIKEPIYFTLDELIEIQSSNDPFTNEEIEDILDTELDRDNYEDINCDVVDFCVDWLLKYSK